MRKGRPGQRGKFVHVEPRLSQTAANADEWIPCNPGMEGAFALSLAHVMMRDKLRPTDAAGHAGTLIDGWSQGLPDYAPEKIASQLGVPAATITRIAHESAARTPAVALIGDTAVAGTRTASSTLVAVNALTALLGSVGKPGGVLFSTRCRRNRRALPRRAAPPLGALDQADPDPHPTPSKFCFCTTRIPCSRHRRRLAVATLSEKFHLLRASEVSSTKPASSPI